MSKISLRIVFLVLVLGLLLSGCGPAEKTVDEVYWEYHQACEDSKYGTASDFLTESARLKADQVGVCGFVHEIINIIELNREGLVHTFTDDPEVILDGDSARMMWIDDQGFITIVVFVSIDGQWLVDDIIWST